MKTAVSVLFGAVVPFAFFGACLYFAPLKSDAAMFAAILAVLAGQLAAIRAIRGNV